MIVCDSPPCPACGSIMVLMTTKDRWKCFNCQATQPVEKKPSPIRQVRTIDFEPLGKPRTCS